MPKIRVYEPALCCNTGVCGQDVDDNLVRFTADLAALQSEGVDIARANLATDPQAFADSEVAVAFLQTLGSEGLPLTLVDDVTALTGRYPSRDEMRLWAGLADSPVPALPLAQTSEQPASCCSGSTCC